jgi:hypothetical protein
MQRLPEIAENCGIENAVALDSSTTAMSAKDLIVLTS